NHLYSNKLFSNAVIYSGTYQNQLFFNPNFWKAELGSLGFKMNFTHYRREGFEEKFGLELQSFFTNPGSLSLDTTDNILPIPNLTPNYSWKPAAYHQAEWKIKRKWKARAGIRMTGWNRNGPDTYYTFDENYEVNDTIRVGRRVYNRYLNLDPRLSLRFEINPSSQLKLSYGTYHQYLQLASNSISPFTSLEVWLPAGPNIFPQSSRQWSLGYLKYWERAKMEFSASAYHKFSDGQMEFKPHANTYLNPLLEGELRFGTSRAYGVELLLKKEFGRLNGWMAYTYSRTFRTILGINEGREYPAIQDRPHDFSLFLNYRLSDRSLMSVYWTSFSGANFSSPTGFLSFNDQPVPIYDEKNNDRLPAYHRMDVSIKIRLNKQVDRKYQHSLTFSMYNILGHINPYIVQFNKIPTESITHAVKTNILSETPINPSQISLGRFLPSISYRFKL
ncbi:MAG: TonB-dependent receptor, partial [Bacteroidota bacterium]